MSKPNKLVTIPKSLFEIERPVSATTTGQITIPDEVHQNRAKEFQRYQAKLQRYSYDEEQYQFLLKLALQEKDPVLAIKRITDAMDAGTFKMPDEPVKDVDAALARKMLAGPNRAQRRAHAKQVRRHGARR